MAKRKLAETFPDFPAGITPDDVEEIEKAAQGFGEGRRLLLASLARSRAQLIEADGKMTPQEIAELITQMLESGAQYQKHLASMQDMAERAMARLFIAGKTMIDRGMAQ